MGDVLPRTTLFLVVPARLPYPGSKRDPATLSNHTSRIATDPHKNLCRMLHTSQRSCTLSSTSGRSSTSRVSTCRPSSRRKSFLVRATAAGTAPPVLPYRVGHGFDLHRLAEGYKLVIGGLEIPHTKGCEAHSDGDVLLHTVTDAILGALCMPDIGQLFPDTDPKWKGARSDIFLKEAVRLMEERGYVVGNLDCTIIAQKPKLSPHKENIRDSLCSMIKAHPTVVNIKAKTHEKVDSIGEERAIACHAVILLIHQKS